VTAPLRLVNGENDAAAADGRLRDKQRQFNAAMELYTSRPGYRLFGMAVALVNVTLQAWLLWRVWPQSIGVGGQLAAIVCAWVLADFVNGLVHLYMDNNDRYEGLTGPLVANFHLHHKVPVYQRKSLPVVYFVESGAKVWLAPCLMLLALMTAVADISPLVLHILVYSAILSSVAEVSHYLCHTSVSPVARFLGDYGILLGKRHHAVHHLQDNVSYAFLNGVTDPLINRIAASLSRGYKNHTDLHYAGYQFDESSR
jgi:hypothetical protein